LTLSDWIDYQYLYRYCTGTSTMAGCCCWLIWIFSLKSQSVTVSDRH
jgi:hypothetical protein